MIAGLILAGGAATRMGGGDKPLRLLAGEPVLAHLLRRLRPQVAMLALSANGDPARFSDYQLPVLADGAFTGQGPLAGLLAGLEWAAGQGAMALLSVPGDTPFIPPDLAARLAPAPSIAASGGRGHPLVGLWPVVAAAALRAMLTSPGSRAVARLAEALGARTVTFTGTPDPFFNLNTPEDLARAAEFLA